MSLSSCFKPSGEHVAVLIPFSVVDDQLHHLEEDPSLEEISNANNVSRMISLNGNNWMIWKPRMEDLLYCKDLNEPLQGDSAKPTTMTDNEWKRLDRKTIGFIRQWLDDSVFHHVSTEISTYSF
ncbi:unnamed protein product [Musa acuminata var. zebrina]